MTPRRPLGRGRVLVLAAALLALPAGASGQAPASPQGDAGGASLDDFAWLAGTWRGPGPEGATAEIHFMEPRAGVLPSVFRLVQGERVLVLEALTLVREGSDLVLYVRHFDPALVPMEESHAIALNLVGRDGDTWVFENVREGENPRRSFMTRTEDGFVSRSELARPDGTTAEIRVEYRRIEPG